MSNPFHIYRSGAGSGKTYTLAQSYLKIALQDPKAFQMILGVTFTNKATEEMKGRIVRVLKELSNGENASMQKELCEALSINEKQLAEKARATLSNILHQYGRFNITTIDSFFNQVIRAFTREMGLQGTFTIDLDQKGVLEKVVEQMLLEIGNPEKKELRTWLTKFAELRVEEGKQWDFREEIATLAKEIFKEGFRNHIDAINRLTAEKGGLDALLKSLNTVRYSFESQIKGYPKAFFDYLDKNDLSITDFTRGGSGPAGLFNKFEKLDFEITEPRRLANGNIEAWLTKANLKKGHLNDHLESHILPLYGQMLSDFDNGYTAYISAVQVLRYFFTFGILTHINKYIQQYRDENDVMLIADLPDFLHQIIHDSDTPFIYEKVGSTYQHYLIDEFQDTSAFQWENFMPLVKNGTDEGKFSMVVGDVKQSIYRFRGGDWELLQSQVKTDIGDYNTDQFNLDTNWRSAPKIVAFNNELFTATKAVSTDFFKDQIAMDVPESLVDGINKRIEEVFETFSDVSQEVPLHKDTLAGNVRIEFLEEEDSKAEKEDTISRTIKYAEELQRQGYELRDMAVLTRNSREGATIAKAFLEYGNSELADPALRYDVVSSEALFLTSSHVVKFLVAMIKWLHDEKDVIVLAEWVYEYQRFIKTSELSDEAIFSSYALWESLVSEDFLQQKQILKAKPLYEVVESLVDFFDLNKNAEEFTYLQGFQDAILDYSKNERGDIASFIDWWEETGKLKAIKISDDNNAIKILTIHKSKGLEFPIVFIPFLSWSFDQDPKKNNILWCEGAGKPAPFNKLPIVPLRYESAMAKTYWADAYYEEKLKAYLDNLNLLYVAFTRPVEWLIAFGKKPKKSKFATAADILYPVLSQMEGWNEAEDKLHIGVVQTSKTHEVSKAEVQLTSYPSSPWRKKVNLQLRRSGGLLGTLSKVDKGIVIHDLLSKIHYLEDLEKYKDHEEFEVISQVANEPTIKGWFDPSWKVYCEVPILLPGGDFRRIDRLNLKENETVIIDFKTGEPRNKDLSQVKEYASLLSQMGYSNISGYLIYLQDLKVVAV